MSETTGEVHAKIKLHLSDEAEKKMDEIVERAAKEIVDLYEVSISTELVPDSVDAKDDFKVGDVVHLKSGGPEMTIIEITKDLARSAYFDYALSKGAEIGPIPLICLEK